MNYAFAAVFFAAGIIIFGFSLAATQTRRRIAAEWIPVEAFVIECNVEAGRPWAFLVVKYGYHSEDVYFEHEETISAVLPFSRRQIERLASQYSPADPVTAFVDPDNHQASTLLATSGWTAFSGFTWAAIFLCAGAIALAA